MSEPLKFGPYSIEADGNHATIRRIDGGRVEPAFYEMQYLKDMAFGGAATAVEVLPAYRNLVDAEHQRHLWRLDEAAVPNLSTGYMVGEGGAPESESHPDGEDG